eukprot:gene12879-14205_t
MQRLKSLSKLGASYLRVSSLLYHKSLIRNAQFPLVYINNVVASNGPNCRFASTDLSSVMRGTSKAREKLIGKTVRIGCASGFWGDTAVAAPQLVEMGQIDFLMFDYLSEITMSLLTAAKKKSSDFGYAPDFVSVAIGPLLKDIKKKGIRVLSNAGGVNPLACAKALENQCKKAGIEMKIAVVTGDDLMHQLPEIIKGNMGPDVQSEVSPKAKFVNSMNAYLGAGPIVKALDSGADIVVTGRCVDSALALAPLMHSFKWSKHDFDLLAAGSLAGHLIECGAQVTGGIFSGWEMVPDWHNIGFPIVECATDGSFIVTKPPRTGGIVSKGTVAEQLVYEIDDPKNYFLPDVTCDFSQVTLHNVIDDDNNNAVLVKNVMGKVPTSTFKVSGTYLDGFRATAVCPVVGPHAVQKAERVAESILARCKMLFHALGLPDFTNTNVEYLGSEHSYGIHGTNSNTREIVMWIAVQHQSKEALQIFAREIAPAGTGMAPGLTHLVGGRPKVSPVLKLFSYLYPREKFDIDIFMNGEFLEKYHEEQITKDNRVNDVQDKANDPRKSRNGNVLLRSLRKGSCTFPLGALAYTRSGDKGNNANIGVVCKNPGFYPYLAEALTEEVVQSYFSHLFEKDNTGCSVKRYELPGISAFNFVLENSLGGGGIASLRSDPQGKAFGQMLLDFKVKNVPDLLPSTSERLADSYGD